MLRKAIKLWFGSQQRHHSVLITTNFKSMVIYELICTNPIHGILHVYKLFLACLQIHGTKILYDLIKHPQLCCIFLLKKGKKQNRAMKCDSIQPPRSVDKEQWKEIKFSRYWIRLFQSLDLNFSCINTPDGAFLDYCHK